MFTHLHHLLIVILMMAAVALYWRQNRRFFLSAIYPRCPARNPAQRQLAAIIGKEYLSHFVGTIVPALEDRQLLAEALGRMSRHWSLAIPARRECGYRVLERTAALVAVPAAGWDPAIGCRRAVLIRGFLIPSFLVPCLLIPELSVPSLPARPQQFAAMEAKQRNGFRFRRRLNDHRV